MVTSVRSMFGRTTLLSLSCLVVRTVVPVVGDGLMAWAVCDWSLARWVSRQDSYTEQATPVG